MKFWLFACVFAATLAEGCGAPTVPVSPASSRAAALAVQNLRGITYDDISSRCSASSDEIASERKLDRPTVRVVFDPIGPACYASAMKQLDRYGTTMGELIDSSAMRRYSLAEVRARAQKYVARLGGSVGLWEIGNEINGEWLSKVKCPHHHECAAQARDVMSKVEAMYDEVAKAGYPSEITLYYQPPKTVTPGYEMIPWEERYVPATIRSGVRYALVSYYESGNDGIRPSRARWDAIFRQLAADFPNAEVGFGEIGMDHPIDRSTLAQARDIFHYYQSLQFSDVPRFTRAGFWWYSAEDLVPSTKWPAFFREVRKNL